MTVHLRHGDHVFSEFELRRLVPTYRDTDTWACGPAGLMALIDAAYTTGDGTNARLRTEFFKPPRIDDRQRRGRRRLRAVRPGGRQHRRHPARAGRGAGLKPEFGCRMGICFSCTSRKTEGTVRNVLTGAESALPDEDIQICVTTPVGDVAVDL